MLSMENEIKKLEDECERFLTNVCEILTTILQLNNILPTGPHSKCHTSLHILEQSLLICFVKLLFKYDLCVCLQAAALRQSYYAQKRLLICAFSPGQLGSR